MHERADIDKKYINMNIMNFMETFPDEDSCKDHFRLRRESEGVKCKKCNCTDHYWLKAMAV